MPGPVLLLKSVRVEWNSNHSTLQISKTTLKVSESDGTETQLRIYSQTVLSVQEGLPSNLEGP